MHAGLLKAVVWEQDHIPRGDHEAVPRVSEEGCELWALVDQWPERASSGGSQHPSCTLGVMEEIQPGLEVARARRNVLSDPRELPFLEELGELQRAP